MKYKKETKQYEKNGINGKTEDLIPAISIVTLNADRLTLQ
jgi:hypothetical protein